MSTDDPADYDELFAEHDKSLSPEERAREEASRAVDAAILRMARAAGAEVRERPVWPGAASTIHDTSPAAGIGFAVMLRDTARRKIHGYIRQARQDGLSWQQVGQALRLGPAAQERGVSLAEAAFENAAGAEHARPFDTLSFGWMCPACQKTVVDTVRTAVTPTTASTATPRGVRGSPQRWPPTRPSGRTRAEATVIATAVCHLLQFVDPDGNDAACRHARHYLAGHEQLQAPPGESRALEIAAPYGGRVQPGPVPAPRRWRDMPITAVCPRCGAVYWRALGHQCRCRRHGDDRRHGDRRCPESGRAVWFDLTPYEWQVSLRAASRDGAHRRPTRVRGVASLPAPPPVHRLR